MTNARRHSAGSAGKRKSGGWLERFSQHATRAAGSSPTFAIACSVVVLWALLGPIFHFSDTWQLVINTSTTIVTFLMVFLIQRAQNKDAMAIQLKLNELLASIPRASNHLIDAEDFEERQLEILHEHYRELAKIACREAPLERSHSLERAAKRARTMVEDAESELGSRDGAGVGNGAARGHDAKSTRPGHHG